jgi:LytR cell envelope-related transcriptional attenuator
MTALTLALSLSSSFTKVGAIAAFVALVGIAILSLLVFSQAREIKRLREWAGRAPERAAEMEQRVSAGASVRAQRGSAPAAPQGRVVPRTTPLVSAPVATAVGASAAAVTPATVTPATEASVVEASAPVTETPVQAKPEEPAPSAQPSTPPAEVPEATSAAAVATVEPKEEKSATTPAPVTAAAQGATRAAPRSPLPPSPAAPQPAAPRSGSIAAAQASSSRVVNSRPRAAAGAVASGAASRAAAPVGGGRKDFRQKRSPTRAIVLGVGVSIVVVLVLIFAVSALKGGSSTPTAAQNTTGSRTASSTSQTTTTHKASRSAVAANPAETSVVVLNGTGTTGLAHHLASDLQQSGYARALASAAVPPGTHQSTVIEYSSGHRADAQGVAKTLNVTQIQPMDSTISGLAGSATVVVLAGADQAAQLGGGGAQSQGEPAVGQ